MELEELLETSKYTATNSSLKWNQYRTDPNKFEFNIKDVNRFNEIYQCLKASDLNTIERTKSGAIGTGLQHIRNCYAWDVIVSKTGVRITILINGKIYVYRLGVIKEKDTDSIAPWKAWLAFTSELVKDKIDINNYKITPEEGKRIKETIPDPLICFTKYQTKEDKPLENVHHIDFHNSYPAGLCNKHPEFRKTITRLYNKRKTDETYKAILNYAIGSMQSLKHPWQAQWAHLAKDAITDNFERIQVLAFKIKISGRKILGFNTDGIWYQGDIYHGDSEGPNLGQWHNDHTNCLFRAKSDGAYEYIENNEYHPVLRGFSNLDKYKSRDEWSWGDIYQEEAKIINFDWDNDKGVILNEERL